MTPANVAGSLVKKEGKMGNKSREFLQLEERGRVKDGGSARWCHVYDLVRHGSTHDSGLSIFFFCEDKLDTKKKYESMKIIVGKEWVNEQTLLYNIGRCPGFSLEAEVIFKTEKGEEEKRHPITLHGLHVDDLNPDTGWICTHQEGPRGNMNLDFCVYPRGKNQFYSIVYASGQKPRRPQ